jgi:hypothetical protein
MSGSLCRVAKASHISPRKMWAKNSRTPIDINVLESVFVTFVSHVGHRPSFLLENEPCFRRWTTGPSFPSVNFALALEQFHQTHSMPHDSPKWVCVWRRWHLGHSEGPTHLPPHG